MVVQLTNGPFSARVTPRGGSILRLDWNGIPLMRPAADTADPLDSACYPLVPFGNRVRDNQFKFDGEVYHLTPNTDWDPHYLHGEGWCDTWDIKEQAEDRLVLAHSFSGARVPYAYHAEQSFVLSPDMFEIGMTVRNDGARPMPFGIGWHPYFPMTPDTRLRTETGRMWTEEEGWLPGNPVTTPDDLDFSGPAELPHRWVNNGFEDWSGHAEITWPERDAKIEIDADPLFDVMFLFVSDTSFDPTYKRDFFALEPMSHLADGHNLEDLGGLRVLQPGETLSGKVRFRPSALREQI